MNWPPSFDIRRLFDPQHGASDRLIPRWLFLRALGLIYFSAFYSLVFQIRGLIGPQGILPAGEYLQAVAHSLGHLRFWFAPTLLWFSSGPHMLMGLCWVGMAASLLLVLNLWPRGMLLVCFVCYLSFVGAAQDFAGYQSDGMLLEAGFIALFFVASGWRPGWGAERPPSRASLFLLQWEWFRIYFESGVAKIASGDPEWRHLTAMDQYYQNGPLPSWIGWYAQHLPHGFQASTAFATLAMELAIVWMLFLPRRFRIICFFIVTPWEIGVILTANYTFLNYLVLALGVLLLDDRFLSRFLPSRWRKFFLERGQNIPVEETTPAAPASLSILPSALASVAAGLPSEKQPARGWRDRFWPVLDRVKITAIAVILGWLFYASAAELVLMILPWMPLPRTPLTALEPFRIADQYGLFAVMTTARYEIEFQGSNDGKTWTPYPFRYKPQGLDKPPGLYAPYQPRFDWNLWFASLGSWRDYPIVLNTEERILQGSPDVLALFAGHPFPNGPPRLVRAVLYQYWFTSLAEKRSQGLWWRRELLGLYAPMLEREDNGKIALIQ